MPAVKVGTCNYCGTRAALVLKGDKRHELTCSTCGAPLHDMKLMPRREESAPAQRAQPAPSHDRAMSRYEKPSKSYQKPRKKKKSFKARALSELWDIVEDIFD